MAVRIGITLGDPTGIGPELVESVLRSLPASQKIERVVYGDARVLADTAARAGRKLDLGGASLVAVSALSVEPGRPTIESGRAQVDYLERAVRDIQSGQLDALVTAPISKTWARRAGFAFDGHTDFLAARLSTTEAPLPVTMFFAGPRLRVALATVHIALAEVPTRLSSASLQRTIAQTCIALRDWMGIAKPRVAIAGLNPHAGEEGQFGDEEARLVAPAIAYAQRQLPFAVLSGPHVPDAVFRRALIGADGSPGDFDAVVALYHDQGLIAVKTVDFEDAVNVTLGLPIVRTSPDHGVAYDIAGRGRARTASFAAAYSLAHTLVERSR